MPFAEIKQLLHESIGLHADTIGESSIDRAISHRMSAIKCESAEHYLNLVRKDKDELDELIEEVVVPETWFFRNTIPFDVLRENAKKIYRSTISSRIDGAKDAEVESGRVMRLLSIPSSTGEEPYSLAMTLLEAGLKKGQFSIDAIDVSKRALRKARRAIYGKHSFREKGLNLKKRYFDKVQSGYRLIDAIQECVNFEHGNILLDSIGRSKSYYDVIFCRNLLIYFDRGTQRKILHKLAALLKSNGLLFVGHAESSQIDSALFKRVNISKAFAFQKIVASGKLIPLATYDSTPTSKLKEIFDQLVEVTKKDEELARRINKPKAVPETKVVRQPVVQDIFQKINLLINSGHHNDASFLCEEHLRKYPESADAYYFLGLISNLQGGVGGAETLLRKAIYLDPHHQKALALSAMLAEKRGEADVASAFRRREKKARERDS